MMQRIESLFVLVPLEQRKIDHPDKLVSIRLVSSPSSLPILTRSGASALLAIACGPGHQQDQVAVAGPNRSHDLVLLLGREELGDVALEDAGLPFSISTLNHASPLAPKSPTKSVSVFSMSLREYFLPPPGRTDP